MGINRALRDVKSKVSVFLVPQGSQGSLKSPVPHLIHTNVPPTEAEIQSILKSIIAPAEEELASLQLQAESLSKLSSPLKRRIQTCEEFIQVHRTVLSPWRRLPVEILVEIFTWFLPTCDPVDITLPYLYTRNWTPLRLVCREWRATLHSIPRMFSVVPKVQLNKKTEDPRYVEHLARYLTWSKDAPLHVTVYAPFREYDAHPALDALVVQSSRWEFLQLELAFWTFKSLFKVKGRLDSLRHLTIDIWRYGAHDIPKLDIFKFAPKLETVMVDGVFPARMELPWTHLRAYAERVFNHGALETVLTQSSRLERLRITQRGNVALAGQITLPCLKILRFRHDEVVLPHTALNHLVLPALEEAKIIGHFGYQLPAISSLLFRSSCTNLRRLAFHTQTTSPGQLVVLLQHTPRLVELDINQIFSSDADKLIYTPGRQPLVPLLERFRVRFLSECDDEDTYREIGRTRCEITTEDVSDAVRPLKEFRFIFESEMLCATWQASLDCRFDPLKRSSPDIQRLLELKNNLLLHLPEIDDRRGWDSSIPKKRAFDLSYAKRLNGIFTEIEKLCINDVENLQLSELHFVLKKISNIRENHIPSDEKYRFRERAVAILQSWRPLFISTIDNFRWVKFGKSSLVYVSTFNDLRKQEDYVDKFIYGAEDSLHEVELFWYRYM